MMYTFIVLFLLGPALISKNIDVTQQAVVDQIMLDVRI